MGGLDGFGRLFISDFGGLKLDFHPRFHPFTSLSALLVNFCFCKLRSFRMPHSFSTCLHNVLTKHKRSLDWTNLALSTALKLQWQDHVRITCKFLILTFIQINFGYFIQCCVPGTRFLRPPHPQDQQSQCFQYEIIWTLMCMVATIYVAKIEDKRSTYILPDCRKP
jgi:hypothetical protein